MPAGVLLLLPLFYRLGDWGLAVVSVMEEQAAELEFEPPAFLIPEPEFFHSLEIIFDSWKSLILLAGENPCRNSKMRPFLLILGGI